MNVLSIGKINPYLRILIYLIGFLICFFSAYSISETVSLSKDEKNSSFRIMTYNIHHGEGLDGVMNLERIAGIIKQENPDIVLLQEVDLYVERSGTIDIPKELSEMADMEHYVFGKNLDLNDGAYGNTTLSKEPVKFSKNIHFEQIGPEQRGVLVTLLEFRNKRLLVLNTHFDHSKEDSERLLCTKKVFEEIIPEYEADAILFGGDFNDIPNSEMHNRLTESLNDSWTVSGKNNGMTFPSDQPAKRIDYIFYSSELQSTATWVPETEASDHRPLVSEFVFN